MTIIQFHLDSSDLAISATALRTLLQVPELQVAGDQALSFFNLGGR